MQLYSPKLQNNFQAQHLMEFQPAEYVRQKMKLKAIKNRSLRKYNRPQSKTKEKTNIYNLLLQLERERLGLE